MPQASARRFKRPAYVLAMTVCLGDCACAKNIFHVPTHRFVQMIEDYGELWAVGTDGQSIKPAADSASLQVSLLIRGSCCMCSARQ